MKKSILHKNKVNPQVVELISCTVSMISLPERRSAMGEVTLSILDGKPRVAEDVFGWSRVTTQLGIKEIQNQLLCVNDISNRRKPKTEEKNPKLLSDIKKTMRLVSRAEASHRSTIGYPNITAKSVYR